MIQHLISEETWSKLADQSQYDAGVLAGQAGVSARQLQRHFKKVFARTPQKWLNERRIAAAQRLLLCGNSVKAVAADLGFKQTSHFCQHFKSLTRMKPSEYLRANEKRLNVAEP